MTSTSTATPTASATATPRRTQAERSAAMRERIVAAAVDLLARTGYASFRVGDVALLAGVSRGAQTHHFPTKDSLILAALEKVFHESRYRSVQRAGEAGSRKGRSAAIDVVDALLDDGREFFLGPYFYLALDMLNLSGHGCESRPALLAMSATNRLPVEQAWTDALMRGGLPAERARNILALSFSVIRGLAVRQLMTDDVRHVETVLGEWRSIAQGLARAG